MELSPEDRRILLETARGVINARLEGRAWKSFEAKGDLARPCGAFVTLKAAGDLRGCIGRMDAGLPLLRTVEAMALAAAFEDPRFPPLSRRELPGVCIEISVLTPMVPVKGPDEVVVGKHGVHIYSRGRSGVFLPQVPVEWGWDRDTYLRQLCRKAGLDESALADPLTKLSVFEAIVFGEDDQDRA
jgi:AmmeMemoRadiSam system protein A